MQYLMCIYFTQNSHVVGNHHLKNKTYLVRLQICTEFPTVSSVLANLDQLVIQRYPEIQGPDIFHASKEYN